jgi:hypothetical protein
MRPSGEYFRNHHAALGDRAFFFQFFEELETRFHRNSPAPEVKRQAVGGAATL